MLPDLSMHIRSVLALVLLLAAGLALASCQSVAPGVGGVAASADAASRVAAIRSQNGLSGLRPDRELERLAVAQAAYMASSGRMVHDTGWRRDFASRMQSNGIRGAAAENIALGRFDTARVISIWMNSAGHRRNMLDERFSRFGLAYAADPRDPSRRYWAMILGQ